jgi:ketosteroid isomerase-like protein
MTSLLRPLFAFAKVLGCAGLLASAATFAAPATPIDLDAVKHELLAVDAAFSDHSVRHGMAAAFDAYVAEDGVKFERDVGVIKGRAAISASNKDVPRDFLLTWTALFADVAASGDLGYTYGSYASRITLPDGSVRRGSGHYTTIWKRQSDGSWKWVLDTGVPNTPVTDAPPAAAAAPPPPTTAPASP